MFKFFLAFILVLSVSIANAQNQPPNIILFLVDDMGWQDTSVPFWTEQTPQNKKFKTPNMERLAIVGQKFVNAYATPICTPSRVSLLTGMNMARHRVTNWTMYKNKGVDSKDSLLAAPEWNVNGLSPVAGDSRSAYATPLPQILKDNGYYTIHCGKAHFGAYQTPGADPLKLGFVKNIGGGAAGNPASYFAKDDFGYDPKHFNIRADLPNLQQYWGKDIFLTEVLTREAEKAMDTARMLQKPFFLYMAHYAVHLPFDADSRFVQKYIDEGYTKQEAAYCALIEGMDKSLGDLMDYLKNNNLDKNTIIIFTSDNGGFSHSPRQGKDDTQNYPLRDGKGSLYEGGIREPMIVYWQGTTKSGSISRQNINIEDIYPTVLEMATIRNYKTVQQEDGQSFVPYLKNNKKQDLARPLIWHFPNGWAAGGNLRDYSWQSAIRQGKWKLIYLHKEGQVELYDLQNDIGEQHDLSKRKRAKTKKLTRLLTARLKSMNAQMPRYKESGKLVAYPDEIIKNVLNKK